MVRLSLAFIDGLGTPEMILIFVIVLVLFGGQKLPEFARGLGKSIREFKKAAAGVEEEFKRALEEDERKHVTPKIAPSSTPALIAAPVVHGDAPGPEAIVHEYDEYGNETSPTPHPSTEPGASAAPSDPVPFESAPTPPPPLSPLPPVTAVEPTLLPATAPSASPPAASSPAPAAPLSPPPSTPPAPSTLPTPATPPSDSTAAAPAATPPNPPSSVGHPQHP